MLVGRVSPTGNFYRVNSKPLTATADMVIQGNSSKFPVTVVGFPLPMKEGDALGFSTKSDISALLDNSG